MKAVLHAKGIAYRFFKKAGDVARLIREIIASGGQIPVPVIFLGMDGTVIELLQRVDDTSKVILGYIPIDSRNDIARDMKIPRDPSATLDIVLNGSAVPMDLGLSPKVLLQKEFRCVVANSVEFAK